MDTPATRRAAAFVQQPFPICTIPVRGRLIVRPVARLHIRFGCGDGLDAFLPAQRVGGKGNVSDIALKQQLPPELAGDLGVHVSCIAGAIPMEDRRHLQPVSRQGGGDAGSRPCAFRLRGRPC